MTVPEHRHIEAADEVRSLGPGGTLDVLNLEQGTVGRLTLEPGWRWSTDTGPLVDRDRCPTPHVLYHLSGTLHIAMTDGTEFDAVPGDVTVLPEGHDAWVVGDEAVVVVDFFGVSTYQSH